MIHKILVADDGSDAARTAFDFGLELARKYEAELHVLSVARPPDFGTEVETEAITEQSRHHCAQLLHPLESRTGGRAAKFEFVVGHRGRSVFERLLIGSVARQVIAYARCAVTVVR